MKQNLDLMYTVSSRLWSRWPFPGLLSAHSSKASICDDVEAALLHITWATCTSATALLKLIDVYRFWSNICCHSNNVLFRKGMAYFCKTMPNHKLYALQQHGSVGNEVGCQSDLPAWKHLVHHYMINTTEKVLNCWAAGIPMVLSVLLKQQIMQQRSKCSPVQALFECVVSIKFVMSIHQNKKRKEYFSASTLDMLSLYHFQLSKRFIWFASRGKCVFICISCSLTTFLEIEL